MESPGDMVAKDKMTCFAFRHRGGQSSSILKQLLMIPADQAAASRQLMSRKYRCILVSLVSSG